MPTTDALSWPAMTSQCRPWTRWWWPGSAVDEAELTRQLELLQAAGFGGVEISPIYGVEGAEAACVPYLSQRWLQLLRHTLHEARRLGLGADMICGTGWPLGGPWVGAADAAARLVWESYSPDEQGRLRESLVSACAPQAAPWAVLACSPDGQVHDLSEQLVAGRLDWRAPGAGWRVLALFQVPTGQQVKRAAPGGEGPVVDHFSAAAIQRYLAPFEAPLAAVPQEAPLRCLFNDSYEVYGANWSAELLPAFERRRGYDLRPLLPALLGQAEAELVRRVRSDYRQTIAELLLEHFVEPWSAWARAHGVLTRNQAHGAPGNLLDLYAAADIPETETFGSDWLALAGLEPLPGTPAHYGGRAEILAGKLASSAAHLAGRPLCSSESFTWLGEHGMVPLAHMKAALDLQFVMGVNHVVYHGTTYSPASADWPGWLFYASTHVGPSNPCWRDLPALNAYASRCQAWLQAGQPDNDLLLYLPMFDLWAGEQGAQDLLHFLGPHNTRDWLDGNLPAFTAAGRWLWERGYSFDCVSERLLERLALDPEGRLEASGSSYQALVLAGCTLLPPETLARMLELVSGGATLLVLGQLPQDVPGLSQLAERRRQLRGLLDQAAQLRVLQPGVSEARVGQGRLLLGPELEPLLRAAGVRREPAVDVGIELIRRRDQSGVRYFLVNLGSQRIDQWLSLAAPAATVVLFDPQHGERGLARSRAGGAETQVYLQLEPGESLLLRALREPVAGPAWPYLTPDGEPRPITGPWQVEFIDGGPTLPAPRVVEELSSWTDWPAAGEALRAFAGTARYRVRFRLPAAGAVAWALELGDVCHSARVRLDGQELGTLYARPFRIALPQALQPGEHELEIEVSNLMANRLAHLDRQGAPWRRFFFVNMQYQNFDASAWEPLASGLLGPVQLLPLRRLPVG